MGERRFSFEGARRQGARVSGAIRSRPVRSVLLATALASLVLVVFPGLDKWVSSLFYVEGHGFPAASSPLLVSLRRFGQAVTRLAAVLPLVALLVPLMLRRARFVLPPKAALFLLATLVIGPGLIVNTVLKGYWGRARPVEILPFGGEAAFSRAWEIGSACASNCSFVSGEGSASIWLVALAFVVPRAQRTWVAAAAIVLAAAISLNRIAFGGHFLSDVLLAWLLTLLVILAVRPFFYGPAPRVTDEGVERALERLNLAWRHASRLLRRAAAAIDPA